MEQANLTVVNVKDVLPAKYDSKILDAVAGNTFLPRVQLCGGSSDFAKEQKVPMGFFALVTGQDPKVIGDHFDCLILGFRTKAMQIVSKEVHIHYDLDEAEFKRIEEISKNAVFEDREGCMAGPEFLIWIPGEGYATYFLNSPSSQWIAKRLNALTGRLATIVSQLIKGKYTYHAPKVVECNTPMEIPQSDELKAQLEDFFNPKVSEEEMVATAQEARG